MKLQNFLVLIQIAIFLQITNQISQLTLEFTRAKTRLFANLTLVRLPRPKGIILSPTPEHTQKRNRLNALNQTVNIQQLRLPHSNNINLHMSRKRAKSAHHFRVHFVNTKGTAKLISPDTPKVTHWKSCSNVKRPTVILKPGLQETFEVTKLFILMKGPLPVQSDHVNTVAKLREFFPFM